MRKSLVALDTDHIKSYVFGTDKLKEIRGASARLDHLNRVEMLEIAQEYDQKASPIYTNGGSGLFLIDAEQADAFGKGVQKRYRERTKGGASITYVTQELPPDAPEEIGELMKFNLHETLELIRYKLREQKGCPDNIITLATHPFLHPCEACGIEYSEILVADQDGGDLTQHCCASCNEKQREDEAIKKNLPEYIHVIRSHKSHAKASPLKKELWQRILFYLDQAHYFENVSKTPERPQDFNVFRQFTQSKEYLGLIYADANNMGKALEKLSTLNEIKDFAEKVDRAIHEAMSFAIKLHLPIVYGDGGKALFPFDILLLGGDDIVIVTDAAKAMAISATIAEKFRELTKIAFQKTTEQTYTLSIGVVLAPLKYPFALLQDLAEDTLKFAKKAGANARAEAAASTIVDDTRINFIVVSGGGQYSFIDTYHKLYYKKEGNSELYATFRPYSLDNLDFLLASIRGGQKLQLGRTKLHQLRAAILKLNLTTSVSESLAVLRNWRDQQRSYVLAHLLGFNGKQAIPPSDPRKPLEGFPRVTFPWFMDNRKNNVHATEDQKALKVYGTSLLDFAELYDFVAPKEGIERHE